MARRLTVHRHEMAFLRESLSYMERRIFDPTDSQLLRGLKDRIEEHLLGGSNDKESELILEEDEARAASTAFRSYADELSHPGSDASNRRRAVYLRALVEQLEPQPAPWSGLLRWIRKKFRR
jgi:hypothetical protein